MKKSLIAALVIAVIGLVAVLVINLDQKHPTQISLEDSLRLSVEVSLGDGTRNCWSGSGVIIGHGQYVLTAAHVITGGEKSPQFFPSLKQDLMCNQIHVGISKSSQDQSSRWINASIVEVRGTVDLALLKLQDVKMDELPSAVFNSEELPIGTPLWLVGYPSYNSGSATVTNGVISSFPSSAYGFEYGISTDIGCGNSGGPVFNANGEVVAIATLMPPDDVYCTTIDRAYRYEWSKDFIGWARPAKFAQPLIDQTGEK